MEIFEIDIDFIAEKVLARNGNAAYEKQFYDYISLEMDKREKEWCAKAEEHAFDKHKWLGSYFVAYNRLYNSLNYTDEYETGRIPAILFYQHPVEFEGRVHYRNTISEDDKFIKDVLIIKTTKLLRELSTPEVDKPESSGSNLKWTGKPAQLGHIIAELVRQGYIEAPRKKDKEINYNELARQVLVAFDILEGSTVKSLSQSLNPNSENGQLTEERKAKFIIPYIGLIS